MPSRSCRSSRSRRVLADLLEIDIALADEPAGDGARKVVSDLRDGQIAMLENLRWSPGEEANDEAFARQLASYCDVYVNDAFGTAHRAHASTAGMVKFVAFKAAGFVMAKEIDFLTRLLGEVDRPYVAVLGGAKVSRQDRGARRAARARAGDRDRRRDGEHVPRSAGQDARQEQGRARQAADRAQLPAQGGRAQSADSPAERCRRRERARQRRRARGRDRRDRQRHDGARHRTGDDRGVHARC